MSLDVGNFVANGERKLKSFKIVERDTKLQDVMISIECEIPIKGTVSGETYYYDLPSIKNVSMIVEKVVIPLGIPMAMNGDYAFSDIFEDDTIERIEEEYDIDDIETLCDSIRGWDSDEGAYDEKFIEKVIHSIVSEIEEEDIKEKYVKEWFNNLYLSDFDGEGEYYDFEMATLEYNIEIDYDDYNNTKCKVLLAIDDWEVENYIDKVLSGENKQYYAYFEGDLIGSYEYEEDAVEALKAKIEIELANGDVNLDECNVMYDYYYWYNTDSPYEFDDDLEYCYQASYDPEFEDDKEDEEY